MPVNKLETALATTGIPYAHYAWDIAPNGQPFIVWAEDEGDELVLDERNSERITTGTVDLFTRDPSKRATVETAFRSIDGFYWRTNSVQYEDETKLLHFEWTFRTVM